MTIDEMIEVLKAAKEGKAIQTRPKGDNEWIDCKPTFNFTQFEYRVKPEPRVIWVNEGAHGLAGEHYFNKVAAEACSKTAVRQVKFVEVID